MADLTLKPALRKLHMNDVPHGLYLVCLTGVLLTALGCGTKLPVVAGTVTLDGEPLANATVLFLPQDPVQPPAQGVTNDAGKYTLNQLAATDGIQLGNYSVRIATYRPESRDVDPPIPSVTERVPVKYNLETELNAVVTARRSSAEQRFDFSLRSGGPIFQPLPESF